MDASHGENSTLTGWKTVIEEMETTAQAYRDRGWETLEIHPGDSVLIDSASRTGLDVVVPGPEHDALTSYTEEKTFVDTEVFTRESEGVVYLLVVEQSDDETAIFLPAYYVPADSLETLETIKTTDELRLFCRRLNDDCVEFVHTDVDPFLPAMLTR